MISQIGVTMSHLMKVYIKAFLYNLFIHGIYSMHDPNKLSQAGTTFHYTLWKKRLSCTVVLDCGRRLAGQSDLHPSRAVRYARGYVSDSQPRVGCALHYRCRGVPEPA